MFIRRFFSLIYDIFLILALWMAVSALWLTMMGANTPGSWQHLAFQGVLFLTVYAYLMLSWIHQGQTLGMKAFRLHLQHDKLIKFDFMAANLRFFMGLVTLAWLGIALIPLLWQQEAINDRLSQSHMVWRNPKSTTPS